MSQRLDTILTFLLIVGLLAGLIMLAVSTLSVSRACADKGGIYVSGHCLKPEAILK